MRILALLLALPLALAGCVASDPLPAATPTDAPPGAEASAAGWPAIEDAPIRPGVRLGNLDVEGTQVSGRFCTGNFVFRSPDNASLYLGTAAHCVDGLALNSTVSIEGYDRAALATGTLVYSSFVAMGAAEGPPLVLFEDDGGEATRDNNDFALLRIDDAHRRLVHPAMFRYGGPTALADSAQKGDIALGYGGSGLRGDPEEARPLEGCVVGSGERATRLHLHTHAVPGDSGGPLMLADGRALAVLTHAGPGMQAEAPVARGGNTYATNVAAALAFAREAAGIDVELVTWPLLEAPAIPALPCPAP